MSVEYLTEDGQLVMPDSSERQLHTYHPKIETQIGVELLGLAGKDNQVRRIVVAEELSESDKSAIEDWLGVGLQRERPEQS